MTRGAQKLTRGRRSPLARAALLSAGMLTGCAPEPAGPPPLPDASNSLVHGGAERSYRFHVPASYDGSRPVPLVIALHGRRGSGEQFERSTHLTDTSEAGGFLIAYPDGLYYSWQNPGRAWNAGGPYDTWTGGTDDVGFISTLIDRLSRHYRIDAQRVYVLGHSNGGFMVYRLASELADRLAAAASVAGPQDDEHWKRPTTALVSILHIHARDDATVPYEGQTVNYDGQTIDRYVWPSAESVVARWAAHDRCPSAPLVLLDGGAVTRKSWTPCAGDAGVELLAADSGGHTWPTLERWGLSANQVIWEFFSTHPKAF